MTEYVLYIFLLIGSIIIVINNDLFIIFLGLEIQNFCILVLNNINKNSIKSIESTIKFLIMSFISTITFLLGVVFFIYNGSQITSFNLFDLMLIEGEKIKIGSFLIIMTLCFKTTLFPFYLWAPDLYESAYLRLIAIISTLPKISVLSIFVQLDCYYIILCISISSMIIGVIGTCNQTKIKRFIAYSGVVNMGNIVLCLTLDNKYNSIVSVVYMFIYLVNLNILLIIIERLKLTLNSYIIELNLIRNHSSYLYVLFVIVLFSMAGIPPLIGCLPKLYLVFFLIHENKILVTIIYIMISLVSIWYYLRIFAYIKFVKNIEVLNIKYLLNYKEKINNKIVVFYLVVVILLNVSPFIYIFT